jgi:FMN phosphatase YigB (HAD superfamily)
MTEKHENVFLFDVDNTLLNNDDVERDLRRHLSNFLSPHARDRFFQIFEELRREIGYADYLGTLERYRLEALSDPKVLKMSCWLADYPFAQRLYPNAMDAVEHVRRWGAPVILSDGDAVFQPRKIERSGLWEAFKDRVLIYVHKEDMLGDVEKHYPAQHYVMVDDKLRLLTAIKKIWGERVTTVFVRQGHYANDTGVLDRYPPADINLDSIGNLLDYNRAALLKG